MEQDPKDIAIGMLGGMFHEMKEFYVKFHRFRDRLFVFFKGR